MKEYKGYLIDTETSDTAATVLTLEYKHVYTTGNYGRAKSFIDGLTHHLELAKTATVETKLA